MGLIRRLARVDVDFDKKAREFCDRFLVVKNCTQICEQGRLYVYVYGPTVFQFLVSHYYKGDLLTCDAFNWIVLDFSLYKEDGVHILIYDWNLMGTSPSEFVNALNELDKHIINLNEIKLHTKGNILKYTRIGNGNWKLE